MMKSSRNQKPSPEQVEKVVKACRLIELAEQVPSLDFLASSVGMSKFHFQRVFKRITGITPKQFAQSHRSQRVRNQLARTRTVTEAIYAAGFNSNGRFYEQSTRTLGMTPKNFRKGGTGERIQFAAGECSLGAVLVAASEKGICAIALGDDPDELVKALQDQFPRADLVGGDKAFEQIVAKVIGFIESPRIGLDLPLDVRGTAFQQRVWEVMRRIPFGKTVSYTELARLAGTSAQSVRAVATACAANKIAVAIPCHRVVRLSGDLSGYRWGVERKKALLQRECEGGIAT